MDSFNIIKPCSRVLFRYKFIIQTFLSEIFKHNFFALNCIVRWLHSAILATAEAIRLYVSFITPNTLPEYIMRCKGNICCKFILKWFEIFNEIQCSIRAGCHPKVILNLVAVFKRQNKRSHHNKLVLFSLSCSCKPVSNDLAMVLRNQN